MHNQIAARLIKHSSRPQPRQKVAEALQHAVAITGHHAPASQQHKLWVNVTESLKHLHFRMPKY